MIGGMNPPPPLPPPPEPEPEPGPESSGGLGTTTIGLGGAVPGGLGANCGGLIGVGVTVGVPVPGLEPGAVVPAGGLGSKDGGMGVIGGSWSGAEGVEEDGPVEENGGVDDDGGAFGGFTQKGGLTLSAAAARLVAPSVLASAGGGRYGVGCTSLTKLSLKSAFISEFLLLCLSALA